MDNKNYQTKIENAWYYAQNIKDEDTREAVLAALEDGSVTEAFEDRWEELSSDEIVEDLIVMTED